MTLTSLHKTLKGIICFFAFFASLHVSASPITPEQALSNVREFLHSTDRHMLNGVSESFSLAFVIEKGEDGELLHSRYLQQNGNALLYVFNINSNGFVVASGDDMAEPILGVSDEGLFDIYNVPVNLAELLDEYAEEIAWATISFKNEDFLSSDDPMLAAQASRKTVKTLITTKWNQGAPYNQKCKFGKKNTACVTGCVATAMAQLLYYWANTSSVGTYKGGCSALKTYKTTTKKYQIPALSKISKFSWSKMAQKNGQPKNNDSKNAVATLMRYCGQSVFMDYTPTGSGANFYNIPVALNNNFNFKCNITLLNSDNTSSTNFSNLIYKELAAKRPVLMSGYKKDYSCGHAFICDGYSKDKDAFHFNWGWGGSFDGYFKLTALKPNKHNFNYHKMAYIGVNPKANKNKVHSLEEDNPDELDPTEESDLSLEATGIEQTVVPETVVPESLDGAIIYNLQGQRVEHPSNGIFIVNGKKVFIK